MSSEEKYQREEILTVIKWLEQASHQMANACEMLRGTLHGAPCHDGVREAQRVEYNAWHVIEALKREHGTQE